MRPRCTTRAPPVLNSHISFASTSAQALAADSSRGGTKGNVGKTRSRSILHMRRKRTGSQIVLAPDGGSSVANTSAAYSATQDSRRDASPGESFPLRRAKHVHRSAGGDASSFSSLHGRHKGEMTPEKRNSKLQELILQLMEIYIETHGPVILLLDNLHHFDTCSWELLSLMASDVMAGLMIVSALTPNEGSLSEEARNVEGKTQIYEKVHKCLHTLEAQGAAAIELTAFTVSEVRRMMEMLLPGWTIHDSNVAIIHERCEGAPAHIEQMAYFLESHMQMARLRLALPDGVLELIADGDSLVSMRDVIRSRVDKLRPAEQMVLKVCSVLGNSVSLDLLEGAYPRHYSPIDKQTETLSSALLTSLATLVTSNFLVPEPGISNAWRFTNQVTMKTVYELISWEQRRKLHCNLAEALQNVAEVTPMKPSKHPIQVIAYHWEQSCKDYEVAEWRHALLAMGCWKQAAENATKNGAFIEANGLFQKAIDIANTLYTAIEHGQLVVKEDGEEEGADGRDPQESSGNTSGAMTATSSLTALVNPIALAFLHRRMSECYLQQWEHIDKETGSPQAQDVAHSNLLDACLRHCLLALIHLVVPMPGTAIPGGPFHLLSLLCPCCFQGKRRSSVLSGRTSMLFRQSLGKRADVASRHQDAVEHVIDEENANRVLEHKYTQDEVSEIAVVLDLLLQASEKTKPVDIAMVKYTREVCSFVDRNNMNDEDALDTSLEGGSARSQEGQPRAAARRAASISGGPLERIVREAEGILQEHEKSTNWFCCFASNTKRSKAVEEVMQSGPSISHSAFSGNLTSLIQSPSVRMSLQEMAHFSSSRKNRVLPVP